LNSRRNWLEALSGKIDQEYREAFLREDIIQAQIVIAIVAVWVLAYSYADYLKLGGTTVFYQLMALRVIFFCASLGISVRIPKTKNVNLVDFTVFVWSMALVLLSLLANASREMLTVEDIMIHYILLLGFYLLVPNRLIAKIIPALTTTFVDIFILVTCEKSEFPSLTSYTTFTSISTLIAINILGVVASIRSDSQRANQYLIQKTLMDGRAQLKELATTDSLTGIFNRRSFFESAEVQFDRFKRYKDGFSFVVIDIDNLKTINDTYGHPAGDHSIRLLTETISTEKRSSDMVGRLAGDEFGILLPNTSTDKALEVLARIKNTLGDTIVETPGQQQFQVSFSAGVTDVKKTDETFDELYRRADKALLAAKQSGRNRIEKA